MNKRFFISLLFIVTFFSCAFGQERALTSTQYLFNGLLLNPAYSGSHEVFTFSISHRSQWIGFEGAPVSQVISLHWPMNKEKIGLGVLATNEEIGSRSYKSIYINYAYRLQLPQGKLSIGLKGGIANGKFRVRDLAEDEVVFDNNLDRYVVPNFGIGAYYYTDNYYVGASIPLLFGYKDGGDDVGLRVYHDFKQYAYYLTGGYIYRLNNLLKIHPSLLLFYQRGFSFVPDININVIYQDIITGGISYRPKKSLNLLFNYKINYQTKIGVSYDFGMGELADYHNGSLEFTLQYEFGFIIKASDPGIF